MHRLALLALLVLAACGASPGAGLPPPRDTPQPCGGYANGPCPPGTFCHKDPKDVHVADKPGRCRFKPASCPAVDRPVCADDYKTYRNACEADAAGANVMSEGSCTWTPASRQPS